jgi:hypothetical protein
MFGKAELPDIFQDIELKKEAYNEMAATAHWPAQGVWLFKKTSEREVTKHFTHLEMIEEQPDIAKSTDILNMVGLETYFNSISSLVAQIAGTIQTNTTKRHLSELLRPRIGALLSCMVRESHNTIEPFGTGTFFILQPLEIYQSVCSCEIM